MPARIETACQKGGPPDSNPLDFVFFRVSKRSADNIVLNSLDVRVKDLSFIFRVDGTLRKFDGFPVENIRVATKRDYISVDFLIKIHEYERRTVPQITDVLVERVRAVPAVLAEFAKTKKLIDAKMLSNELEEYCRRMQEMARTADPWATEYRLGSGGANPKTDARSA